MLELTRAGITVGWHAVPGHWCLLGATEGGLDLQRFLDQAGVDRAGVPALDRGRGMVRPRLRLVGGMARTP